MNPNLKEFLALRGAQYEVVPHPDAFTSQEQAAASHISGRSWAKVVIVLSHPKRAITRDIRTRQPKRSGSRR